MNTDLVVTMCMVIAELLGHSKKRREKVHKSTPPQQRFLTRTYLGYFASLNSWGGGAIMAPPKISTMDGPINLKIGTDTE